jgi:integrase
MKKTTYQGVYERAAADGRVTLVIRYKIGGTAHTESLGIKGAKVQGGEALTAKMASLIRSDRMTQIAREGEVVLQRGKAAPTLGEVFGQLRDHMHGSPGLVSYEERYSKYLGPRWGESRLDQITEAAVALAVREWKSRPEYRTHYGRAPGETTINSNLTALRRIFNFAVDRDLYFGKVPVSGASRKNHGAVKIKSQRKLNNIRDRVFSPEEINQILDWSWRESRELWLQVRLSVLTGARQSELCGWDRGQHRHHGLRWMDVNWDRQEITLLRKGHIYQTIPVDQEVLDTLRTVTHREPSARVAGPYQRKSWDRCRKELGLNPKGTISNKMATWHSLRHTFATWYLEGGGNIMDLCELMNHSDISITARYLSTNEVNQRKSSSVLAQRLRRSKFKVA